MWFCPKCKRGFKRKGQPHSCQTIPLELHFKNKEKAKKLFDLLFEQIKKHVGKSRVVSIPCCIHLFGKYDYLAALPKRDVLEIRFIFDRNINSPRIKQFIPVSSKYYKYCIDIKSVNDINEELIDWLGRSYTLKDN